MLASACLSPSHAEETRLQVLTSFLPIQAHASAIAGDTADVRQLLNKETGPHDFQLKPADVRKLADANLFLINGAGIEEWLQELTSKAGNRELVVVDTSKGITLLDDPKEIETTGGETGHEHGHGHEHGSGKNPHIWLDPVIARQQATAVLEALKKADPKNATTYEANAKAYFAKLDILDSDYRATLEPLPNKNLISFHDAFPYLAKRYGLNYVGAIAEFPEKDPSPRHLAALVDQIRNLKIGVLFAEKGYAPSLLEKIAQQTGAKVSQLDTLEVGEGNSTAYLERMRANLDALRRGFTQTP